MTFHVAQISHGLKGCNLWDESLMDFMDEVLSDVSGWKA